MSFANEIKNLYQSNQSKEYTPNISEAATAIVAMGKNQLRQIATYPNSNSYIKAPLFGKKSLLCTVTSLYISKNSNNKQSAKGHVFTRKYEGEIYGYELCDQADLNQLVKLITQECKKDDIIVTTKKDLDGDHKLIFEIKL